MEGQLHPAAIVCHHLILQVVYGPVVADLCRGFGVHRFVGRNRLGPDALLTRIALFDGGMDGPQPPEAASAVVAAVGDDLRDFGIDVSERIGEVAHRESPLEQGIAVFANLTLDLVVAEYGQVWVGDSVTADLVATQG